MYDAVLISLPALPPVLVPRQNDIPAEYPPLNDYEDKVPDNTDFPAGLQEQPFNMPGENIVVFFQADCSVVKLNYNWVVLCST